jgi:hypothetical protein
MILQKIINSVFVLNSTIAYLVANHRLHDVSNAIKADEFTKLTLFIGEFRSKVACENDLMAFECNPYSRIAINSASFGRTEYESLQCPQMPGVKEESEYSKVVFWLHSTYKGSKQL